jgi:hypothetical protein
MARPGRRAHPGRQFCRLLQPRARARWQCRRLLRLFISPGTVRCAPEQGPFPHGVLEDLVSWVEEGRVPEQLIAQDISKFDLTTVDLRGGANETAGRGRPLCLFSKTQTYVGGDADMVSSYRCTEP